MSLSQSEHFNPVDQDPKSYSEVIKFQVGPIHYRVYYLFMGHPFRFLSINFRVHHLGSDPDKVISGHWRVTAKGSRSLGYGLCKDSRYTFRTLATLISASREMIAKYRPDALCFFFPDSRHERFWVKFLNYVLPGNSLEIAKVNDISSFPRAQTWTITLPEGYYNLISGSDNERVVS